MYSSVRQRDGNKDKTQEASLPPPPSPSFALFRPLTVTCHHLFISFASPPFFDLNYFIVVVLGCLLLPCRLLLYNKSTEYIYYVRTYSVYIVCHYFYYYYYYLTTTTTSPVEEKEGKKERKKDKKKHHHLSKNERSHHLFVCLQDKLLGQLLDVSPTIAQHVISRPSTRRGGQHAIHRRLPQGLYARGRGRQEGSGRRHGPRFRELCSLNRPKTLKKGGSQRKKIMR